jgi:hypothetical protein
LRSCRRRTAGEFKGEKALSLVLSIAFDIPARDGIVGAEFPSADRYFKRDFERPVKKRLQGPVGEMGKTHGFPHIVAEALQALRPNGGRRPAAPAEF